MAGLNEPHEMSVRVRYHETDAMGYLHHAVYPVYLEMGRTELFRDCGGSYRDWEAGGFYLVVASMDLQFKAPARYDDVLILKTRLVKQTPVRLVHSYELRREEIVVANANTVLACVDKTGKPQRMPEL